MPAQLLLAYRESRSTLRVIADAGPATGRGAMTIWMPVEPEANELLSRSPLALVIALLLDQQVTLEKAFAGPLDLVRRLGHEPTAAELAEFDPDGLAAIFSERPALHRYPKAMAARLQDMARLIVDQYDGDAARLRDAEGADLRGAARQAARGPAGGLAGCGGGVRG